MFTIRNAYFWSNYSLLIVIIQALLIVKYDNVIMVFISINYLGSLVTKKRLITYADGIFGCLKKFPVYHQDLFVIVFKSR